MADIHRDIGRESLPDNSIVFEDGGKRISGEEHWLL